MTCADDFVWDYFASQQLEERRENGHAEDRRAL
jgi:hypothetical protein